MPESDWVLYTLANCPFEKGPLLFSNSRGIYKCSFCFREFTDSQIAPYRTVQPAQEKQSTQVTGTFFQPIQPVSGTVTTNAPANASTNLAQVGGSSLSLGAKTAANSIPVVLASDETALAVTGTFFQPTQPVSGTVTTAPPADASTNVTKIGGSAVSLGAKTSASSIPVVLASDEAALPVTGTFFPATQPVSGTVTANAGTNLNTSLLALEAGGNLAAIKADVDKIPSQGQALAAASMPVVLPATQITALTPPAAITGFALEAGGNLASIKADVDKIPSQGQALSAASMPVVLPATQITTLTPLASVGVNNFPATQPISAVSLPLAGNAAQESSGNLATIALQTRNDAQIVDILNCILAQLKLLNLNLASAIPSAHMDIDAWVMDSLPTFN